MFQKIRALSTFVSYQERLSVPSVIILMSRYVLRLWKINGSCLSFIHHPRVVEYAFLN